MPCTIQVGLSTHLPFELPFEENANVDSGRIGCENNQLYSFLNDADASTTNIAQALFMMPQDIGMTVMPFIELSNGNWTATGQAVPQVGTGSQAGFESCLAKCGLGTSGYASKGPVVMG